MLSKCANPACSTTFRYFREGRLFLIDSETESSKSRSLECYCAQRVARNMTIQIAHGHAVAVCRKKAIQPDVAQSLD